MKHTVYRITNQINGKYYIGVHSTDDINDNYMGSGMAIRRAIKKYGIINFKKEILYIFDNKSDAYDKERSLLENIWNTDDSYNMSAGGNGGWDHINCIIDRPNPMHNPDLVAKMVKTARERGSYHTEARKKALKETTIKASIVNTGKKHSTKWCKNQSEGIRRHFADPINRQKLKERIREKRCKKYVLIDPNSIIYYIDVISEWCKQHNMPLSTITTREDETPIKRGKLKGWIVKKERR